MTRHGIAIDVGNPFVLFSNFTCSAFIASSSILVSVLFKSSLISLDFCRKCFITSLCAFLFGMGTVHGGLNTWVTARPRKITADFTLLKNHDRNSKKAETGRTNLRSELVFSTKTICCNYRTAVPRASINSFPTTFPSSYNHETRFAITTGV